MYDKKLPEYRHHIKTYGKHKDFGYKDFIPMFKGEHFDADKWISLFKESGAKYVMPVAEHHDGFAIAAFCGCIRTASYPYIFRFQLRNQFCLNSP